MLLVVSCVLFVRHPGTNFIFDEQEALLGSEYLLSGTPWWRVFEFDFWGRPPTRTIGSYRPFVTLVFKALSPTLGWHTPWFFSLVSLCVHATCAWLVGEVTQGTLAGLEPSMRRGAAWVASLLFCTAAIATEAVCSVVGLADLFAALWLLLGMRCVQRSASGRSSALVALRLGSGVLTFSLLAMWSKETAISACVLLPGCALISWRPRGALATTRMSAGVAFCATGGLLVSVVVRRWFFPAGEAHLEAFASGSLGAALLAWLGPPALPSDVMNNPLLVADLGTRVATASKLFVEQVVQIVLPLRLNGDYSFPAQPVTEHGVWPALALSLLLLLAWPAARWTWRRPGHLGGRRSNRARAGAMGLAALGSIVLLGSYAPLAQFPILLPTIRAERLLYLPTCGVVFCLVGLMVEFRHHRSVSPGGAKNPHWFTLVVATLIVAQATRARVGALRYEDDVAFWRSTSRAEPSSAKSHLNYGLMLGARGDDEARLRETLRAVELAPEWPMGRLYLADTHCRRDELEQAAPHYLQALSKLTHRREMTALALQCLYERGGYDALRGPLHRLAAQHEGSWLDYLLWELDERGDVHGGLPPEYRARGYNVRVSATVR